MVISFSSKGIFDIIFSPVLFEIFYFLLLALLHFLSICLGVLGSILVADLVKHQQDNGGCQID